MRRGGIVAGVVLGCELYYVGWWEVEGHVVGLGLDCEAGKHLDELLFDDIVTPSDQRLLGFLTSLFQQAEAGLDLEDGRLVVTREGLEAGKEDDRY